MRDFEAEVMLYGIDVSHHQNPSALDWEGMADEGCDFCIVRLTYGTTRDRQCAEHVRRARAVGMRVGAYLFFRPSARIDDQLVAFRTAADAAGYGEPEDIAPVLDFEDDTESRPIRPEHAPLAELLANGLRVAYSAAPLIYITQRDWGRVGRPEWVLELPLWVAHYSIPSRKEPATPNGTTWAIWQHRVGKYVGGGPSGYYKDEQPQIDQNRARYLPLLDGTDWSGREGRDTMPDPAELSTPDDDGTDRIMALMQARLLEGLDLNDGQAADTDPSPPPGDEA